MKKTYRIPARRVAAYVLALALVLSLAPLPALASAGTPLIVTRRKLAEGLTYINTVSLQEERRVESFALELSPGGVVKPLFLQASGYAYGAANIHKAVALAQAKGYHVLAAVNTDFFSLATGVPMGIIIEDGVLKSCGEEGESALLITDGRISLQEQYTVSLSLTNQRSGEKISPHNLNKYRTPTGGLYLMNEDFSPDTLHTSTPGWAVRFQQVAETVPTAENPTAGDPATGDPAAGDPAAEESVAGDPAAGDPAIGDPAIGDPAAGDPATGNPAAGEPATGDSATGDPAAGEPATGDLATGDSVAGKPTAKEPAARNTPVQQPLTVSSRLRLQVTELLETSGDIPIGRGEYILTSDNQDGWEEVFQSFQVGDEVILETACDSPELIAAQWAGGAGDVMIADGKMTDPAHWTYTKYSPRDPRTALGVRADGTAFIYAVDGRQSGYSAGLKQVDLAQEMLNQGCVWAVNLDGGGSTSVSLWLPGQSGPALVNRPSDGALRRCATYLLLVTEERGDGTPQRMVLPEDGEVVFVGSSLPLTAPAVLDAGLNPLSVTAGEVAVQSSGLGQVLTEGQVDNEGETGRILYTAGNTPGTDTLALSSDSLGIQDTAQIHIVNRLTELSIRQAGGGRLSSLYLRPGRTAALGVQGGYWGRIALRTLDGVAWTVDGDVGTVDEQGIFTASMNAGASGTVTASVGGVSASFSVTLGNLHLDVPEGHWAYEAVEYCYDNNLLNGLTPTEYGPDWQITRSDFLLILYRAAGSPAVKKPSGFTDVPPEEYYANAVAWAEDVGLANGVGDGLFLPRNNISRQEAITILGRAIPILGILAPEVGTERLEAFTDKGDVAEWAAGHAATLTACHVLTGDTLRPLESLTRAEMALFLYRLKTYDPMADVTSVTLDVSSLALQPGQQQTLHAALTPAESRAPVQWTLTAGSEAAALSRDGTVMNVNCTGQSVTAVATVSCGSPSASCEIVCVPAAAEQIGVVVTAGNPLNVRTGPGTAHKALGSLANGTPVILAGTAENGWLPVWCRLSSGGTFGYVSAEYIATALSVQPEG